MAILFKNNAASTLSSIYISSTGKFSDLYVADSSMFPSITAGTGDYFYLTLVGDDTLEIVKAFETGTNSSGGKYIRVYRAQEGTVQQNWPSGTRVEMRITAGALQSFFSTEATETVLGVSKLATYQQAVEGTDNTTNMTPRRTVDAIHQFNTKIVETPVVTGTTSVRSGTTYPYTFTASVMGGFDDPIVAFYYVGNQTGSEPFIRVPVTTPANTNATATGDVSFTGNVGDVIQVTTYAMTESGNMSRYGTLDVTIIANNPPDMSTLVHDVPTTGSRYATSVVHFSGVTDADGDVVKYRIKNAVNCSFSKTNNIADGEAVTITWKVPADYPVDAGNSPHAGNSTFTLEAYDFLGGSSAQNFSTNVRYRWANDTQITVTSGTSPELTFTFAAPVPGAPSFIWPNVFVYDICYADGTVFKHSWLTKEETSNWTTGRSVTTSVPWNETLTIKAYWADNGEYDLDTLRVSIPSVTFTTVVTFTAPVWTTQQGQIVTADTTLNVAWTQGTSSPAYTPVGYHMQSSTDPNFVTFANERNATSTLTSYSLDHTWFSFGNPAVTNYVRIRNRWRDTATNKMYYSAWSSPLLQVSGQTASLDAATITSPAANSVLDPSVVIPTTIALGAVTGQTVDKMKISAYSGITADPSSQQPVWTSGEVAYNSSYNIPANTLSWNGVYKLFVDVHGTITGWARDTDGVVVRTIMHKYTGQPNQTYPVQGQTNIPVESVQTYTWTNAPRVGSTVPSYTRVVIYRKSDNAVVFSKETGIDATTCVIPANTLAHNTEYHCRIDNWFVDGGQLDVDDMTKFTSKKTGYVTTKPYVYNGWRASGSYTIPYTGSYQIYALGGGGAGGSYKYTTVNNGPITYPAGGGGGTGYMQTITRNFNAGDVLTFAIGAGGVHSLTAGSGTMEPFGYNVSGSPTTISLNGSVLVTGAGGQGGQNAGWSGSNFGGGPGIGGAGGAGAFAGGAGGNAYSNGNPGSNGTAGGQHYYDATGVGYHRGGGGGGGRVNADWCGAVKGGGGGGGGRSESPNGKGEPGWSNDSYAVVADTSTTKNCSGAQGTVYINSTWVL